MTTMKCSLVSALIFMAIPAIAGAHGGNNDPNMVHACIGNISRIARIVGVNGSCISAPGVLAEAPAHWAIQGAPGAPGTNGAKGADGAPGINGTNGANGSDGTNGADGRNGIDGISVTFVGSFSGPEHGCANGGTIFAAGNANAYVCHGRDAAAGAARPDGPCFAPGRRYVDCGNGTVTDTVTGLIWLKQSDCLGSAIYPATIQVAAGLKEGDCGLTDGSSLGDWRLPTRNDWIATLAYAVVLQCTVPNGKAPALTNDVGNQCLSVGPSSFTGVAPVRHASSTTEESNSNLTVLGFLDFGNVNSQGQGNLVRVWPVRGSR